MCLGSGCRGPQRRNGAQQVAALTQTMSSTEQIALGVGIAAILTMIGSAAYGSLAIGRPMRKMAHVLTTLTKGLIPYLVRRTGTYDAPVVVAGGGGERVRVSLSGSPG